MPNVSKVLGQSAPAATTLTTIYTVPATVGSFTTVSSAAVCNRGVSGSFRIAVIPFDDTIGDQSYLYYDLELDANDTFVATIGITLGAQDIIQAYASHANMSFTLFGVEYEPTEPELPPTAVVLSGFREVLDANRTYYVRTDGNDSNTGLVNDSAGAFLTVQKAVDVVWDLLDLGGFQVTIQLADGTYTGSVEVRGPSTGAGSVVIQGNASTPASVVIDPTLNAFYANGGARITVNDMELRAGAGGYYCISLDTGAQARFQNIRFGTAGTAHAAAFGGSLLRPTGNYSIVGSAPYHLILGRQASYEAASITVTLTGTPAFSQFVYVETNASGWFNSMTFLGSATGSRYACNTNGSIQTYTGNTSLLPGNAAGSTTTGGQYS